MPPARAVDHGWLGGGRRTMHELAVAVACTGRAVEIRGECDSAVLDELVSAAGAAPALPDLARAPTAADTVIVYEGVDDPLVFARVALSPARAVLMLLAAPGLVGWPFAAGWSAPDPLTVETDSLARPEHLRAAAAVGFELWTHMPAMVERAEAAGLECRFLGNGHPVAFPEPAVERDLDAVALAGNRWAPLAEKVMAELAGRGLRCHTAPPRAHHDAVIELFGRARTLVHPARVEGHSRTGCEARAMGAVPIVLDSLPFAVGLDEAGGAVAVPTVAEIAPAALDLIADGERLERLSRAGVASARRQLDWQTYLRRVDTALSQPPPADPGREARAEFGAGLAARERDAAGVLARHRGWLEDVNRSASWRITGPLRAAKRRLRRLRR
jgi:hypothetical protein